MYKVISTPHIINQNIAQLQLEDDLTRMQVARRQQASLSMLKVLQASPVPDPIRTCLLTICQLITRPKYGGSSLPEEVRDELKATYKKLISPKTEETTKQLLLKGLIATMTTIIGYPSVQLMIKNKSNKLGKTLHKYVTIIKKSPYKGFAQYAKLAGTATALHMAISLSATKPIQDYLRSTQPDASESSLELQAQLAAAAIATVVTVPVATAARNGRIALGQNALTLAQRLAGASWGLPRDMLMSMMHQSQNPLLRLCFAVSTTPFNTQSQRCAEAKIHGTPNPTTKTIQQMRQIIAESTPPLDLGKAEKFSEKAFQKGLQFVHQQSHQAVKACKVLSLGSKAAFGGLVARMVHLTVTISALTALKQMVHLCEESPEGERYGKIYLRELNERIDTLKTHVTEAFKKTTDHMDKAHEQGLTMEEYLQTKELESLSLDTLLEDLAALRTMSQDVFKKTKINTLTMLKRSKEPKSHLHGGDGIVAVARQMALKPQPYKPYLNIFTQRPRPPWEPPFQTQRSPMASSRPVSTYPQPEQPKITKFSNPKKSPHRLPSSWFRSNSLGRTPRTALLLGGATAGFCTAYTILQLTAPTNELGSPGNGAKESQA